MKIRLLSIAITVTLVGSVVWLNWPEQPQIELQGDWQQPSLAPGTEPLLPLPDTPPLPQAKVRLGEALFFEPRLSRDNSISCGNCHDLKHGGVDRKQFSLGLNKAMGNVNAPTVFNASLNFTQFWDGRAASLEEQAAGPVHNPIEMDSSWPEVIGKLEKDAGYRRKFAEIYVDGIKAANIVDAIATYERTLLTPSRFDRYLRGDTQAITELELTGYRKFKEYGCTSCHQGVNAGGNMYQKFGVLDDYFSGKKVGKADLGRYNVTGLEEDRHVFKVPALRNVAVTPPYFHNGSELELGDAVKIMGQYQLGRELTPEDVRAIVAFLNSLTGYWQGKPLQ